jgi:hypothetical protein
MLKINENLAIALMLVGEREEIISKQSGLSLSEIAELRKSDDFKRELTEKISNAYQESILTLSNHAQLAKDTLISIIVSENESSRNKLQAINSLMRHLKDAQNLLLENKIAEIERKLEELSPVLTIKSED